MRTQHGLLVVGLQGRVMQSASDAECFVEEAGLKVCERLSVLARREVMVKSTAQHDQNCT